MSGASRIAGSRRLFVGLVVAALALGSSDGASAETEYRDTVVALSVTFQPWDQKRPWVKRQPRARVGSAVVVAGPEGPQLLTRAHLVADATLIQVEKHGNAQLTAARVVHADPEIDLALLAVDAAAFFDDLVPAELATSVPLQGDVTFARWRKRQLEVASSRIARIEVRAARYGTVEHAFVLAHSNLADGGWAEPAFAERRVAGLLRRTELVGITSSQSEQTAALIPAEILRLYLDEAREAAGAYRGFASLGVVWQNNRDIALARFLGLDGEPRGILVRDVRPGSSAAGSRLVLRRYTVRARTFRKQRARCST